MINKGKPEGRWASGVSKFMVRLMKKIMLFFLGLSFLSAIVVYVLLTAYPDEWDKVDLNSSYKEAIIICGPPKFPAERPEKCVIWEWGTEWIYWEFILYTGNHGSRTQVCFFKQGCLDFKIDQSYEKGIVKGVKNAIRDLIKYIGFD